MTTTEAKAEVFAMALQSLSKDERRAVAARLLDDQSLREDVLDIALIRKRSGEPSRRFEEYLDERKARRGA